MQSVWTRLCTATLAALLLLGAKAHAEAIPIYSYTTNAEPSTIDTGVGHSGALTISVQSVPHPISIVDSFFNAAQVTGATLTGDNYQHAGYKLNINITDAASGQTKTASFLGEFNGSFLPGGSQVYNTLFNNNDASQPLKTGKVTQTLTFDNGAVYTVTLNALANVNSQNSPLQTIIGGEIVVQTKGSTGSDGGTSSGNNGGDNSSPSPEPSTMLLSCLGVSCLGLSAWRKRRARKAAGR
jgi:hypothetical protein